MANEEDLLDPNNTPSNRNQGRELSRFAPVLVFIVFALIVIVVIVSIMRRGPSATHYEEEVEIVRVQAAPIGEDSVGEIEAYKDTEEHRLTPEAEAKQIAQLKSQIEQMSNAKKKVELQKNIFWEEYKKQQLQNGQARRDNLLAAVKAGTTVAGGRASTVAADDKSASRETVASITASLGKGPAGGGMPVVYDGSDYSSIAQDMLKNQLAMVGAAGGNGGADQNMQRAKQDFFNKSFSEGDYNYLSHIKVPLQSKYTLKEGSIIDGILVSGINSDLPGMVIAKVSKDIYDTVTGKILLIPQGTELVGQYSSAVSYAQDRVALGWTRLNFPNGDSLNIGNMGAVDQQGYSGLHDQVDNHYFRLFGQIALVSFFQAVPALINPTESSSTQTVQTETTTEQVVAGTDEDGKPIIVTLEKTAPVTTTSSESSGGSGSEFQNEFKESYGQTMAQVGVDLAKRNMSIQPTLKERPGLKFKIIVTQDMVLPPNAI